MDLIQDFFSRTGLLLDIVKLVIAGFLGGLIGFERESHGQGAGFRTNILVALGACLLMLLSLHIEELYDYLGEESIVRVDPARIASYAIASMGFLGAGAIIKGPGTIRGLTTAASLWLVTTLGLAVGAGYVTQAVITGLGSLFVLYYFRRLLRPMFPHELHSILRITCRGAMDVLDDIHSILERNKLEIESVDYVHEVKEDLLVFTFRIESRSNLPRPEIIQDLSMLERVEKIAWEEAEVP